MHVVVLSCFLINWLNGFCLFLPCVSRLLFSRHIREISLTFLFAFITYKNSLSLPSISPLLFIASNSALSHSSLPLLSAFTIYVLFLPWLSVFDFSPLPRYPLSFYHSVCCVLLSLPPSFPAFLPSPLPSFSSFPLANCCISYSWSLVLLITASPPPPLFSFTGKTTGYEKLNSH